MRELNWHRCPPKYRAPWLCLRNRKDLSSITDNTKICSNLFVLGQPMGQHPHHVLYMRGYTETCQSNNLEIQGIIHEWSPNKGGMEEYMSTRRGPVKRQNVADIGIKKRLRTATTSMTSAAPSSPSFDQVSTTAAARERDYISEEHSYCGSTKNSTTTKVCTWVKCGVYEEAFSACMKTFVLG